MQTQKIYIITENIYIISLQAYVAVLNKQRKY